MKIIAVVLLALFALSCDKGGGNVVNEDGATIIVLPIATEGLISCENHNYQWQVA